MVGAAHASRHTNEAVAARSRAPASVPASKGRPGQRKRVTEADGANRVDCSDMPEDWQGKIDCWGYRPQAIDLMRGLKGRWDPGGILNYGEFIV